MEAVIYTESRQEYEMLSGIFEYESPGIMVSRGVMDGSFHLEHEIRYCGCGRGQRTWNGICV